MESDRKREHTLREIRKHQEEGSIHGRPPWGFRVEGVKDAKRFVPTDDGCRWIPWMYQQAIEGKGGVQIARALTEAGVDGKVWSEGVVNHVLRNPINHGYRRNGGNLETDALVSFAIWQEAIAALESRWYAGRSAAKHPAPLVRPICGACYGISRDGCANGLSIMYLHRYPGRGAFYRCSGSGPLRKGCGGRMVPAGELDAIVLEWFSRSTQPHMERIFVPGQDMASELKDLNKQIAEAAARGDYEAVKMLSEKAKEASKVEGSRSRWEYVDSGITRGEYFRSLDREGRRAYIAESVILAERAEDGAVLAGEIILSGDGGATISRWM